MNVLELTNVSVFLTGKSEQGETVTFLCGGVELFLDRQRIADRGCSYFRYRLPNAEKLLTFPEMPPYLMVPFQEPERLEFYFPPKAKIVNFPLIFTKLHDREPLSGREQLETALLEGRLESEKVFRIQEERFAVTDGRLAAFKTCASVEFDMGHVIWRADGEQGLRWNLFHFQDRADALLPGIYRARDAFSNQIRAKSGTGKTVFQTPGAGEIQFRADSTCACEFGSRRLLFVLGQPRTGSGLLQLLLPLNVNTTYALTENSSILLENPNRKRHEVSIRE